MNRPVVLLLSAILVVLLLVLWQVRPDRVSPYVHIAVEALEPPAVAAIDLPEPVLGEPSPAASADDATAPWASEVARGGAELSTMIADHEQLSPDRRERLGSVRQRMLAAIEGGQVDAVALDAALVELAQVRGDRLAGGVSVQALRHNIQVSMQMQTLAQEITDSAGSAASDPAQAEQLQERIQALQALQSQLRLDVTAAQPEGTRP